MKQSEIMKILEDNAYIRTSGTPEELRCAEYIRDYCEKLGVKAELESFPVDMADIQQAELWVDGELIPCTGYQCCGSGEVEAPLYYLNSNDPWSLSQCKGKIVLSDQLMSYWQYQDIFANGAVGFITYNGDVKFRDTDLEQKELREYVSEGKLILGAHVHAGTAISLINRNAKMAKIVVKQTVTKGKSHNVVAEIPGELPETIVFTAHYDTTILSVGVYDNMSGCVGLLGLAEYFAGRKNRHSLRFVWCGSEERGLLGSKAYVADHEADLEKMVLNINLDMIGCIMGKFIACCTTEDKLVHYLSYLGSELGFSMEVNQGVYSSDSTSFAEKGVPAVSFARIAPRNTATIHNRYDTIEVMKAEHMEKDINFIAEFSRHMVDACRCPVERKIPDNMKEKLEVYLNRKRPNPQN